MRTWIRGYIKKIWAYDALHVEMYMYHGLDLAWKERFLISLWLQMTTNLVGGFSLWFGAFTIFYLWTNIANFITLWREDNCCVDWPTNFSLLWILQIVLLHMLLLMSFFDDVFTIYMLKNVRLILYFCFGLHLSFVPIVPKKQIIWVLNF